MNVVITMLKFNLQWYGRVMRDILFRYKILTLFCILLLCPTLASLFNLLTQPLRSLFLYPVKNVAGLCCSLFLYQVFGLIWISIQYVILFKQPWQKYLVTLQLSNIQKKLIDIGLLLFVNIIMWIPLLLASITSIFESSFLPYSILLITTKCIVFIAVTLLTQISLIKLKHYMWAIILIINLLIILFSVAFSQLSQLILMVILVYVIYVLISSCYENQSPKSAVEEIKSSVFISRVSYKQSLPILRVQVKNLLERSSQLTMLFSVMLITSLIATILMVYGKTNPFLPFFLSITMLINSLSVSNIFKHIHTQWQEFSGYLASLPISKISLVKSTLIIASCITILFNIIIIIVAALLRGNDLVSKIITAFLLAIALLVASYIPQIKFQKYGFFVSFCLMFVFLYVDYLLI